MNRHECKKLCKEKQQKQQTAFIARTEEEDGKSDVSNGTSNQT
jgi:hypothetical protein